MPLLEIQPFSFTYSFNLLISLGTCCSLLPPRCKNSRFERRRMGRGNCSNWLPLRLSSLSSFRSLKLSGSDFNRLCLSVRVFSLVRCISPSGNSVNRFPVKSTVTRDIATLLESSGRELGSRLLWDRSSLVTSFSSILLSKSDGRRCNPSLDKERMLRCVSKDAIVSPWFVSFVLIACIMCEYYTTQHNMVWAW